MKNTNSNTIHLGFDEATAKACDHIAYFWETETQFRRAVLFLEHGLQSGDHCVIFGHDAANKKVLRVLKQRGYEQKMLIREGKLSVLGAKSSGTATLASIGKTFQRALDRGAHMIRLLGNIGWGKQGWPQEQDLLRFEAQVTSAAEKFPCVIICMYDVRHVAGRVILHGAFQTHPVTIAGNVVRENPHYMPIPAYLEGLEPMAKGAAAKRIERRARARQ